MGEGICADFVVSAVLCARRPFSSKAISVAGNLSDSY